MSGISIAMRRTIRCAARWRRPSMRLRLASIEISELIGRGALAGITGQSLGEQNADGDAQKDLDIRADDIIRRALKSVPYAALASEEASTPEAGDASAPILIAYDPLDGSSNIETNMTVGTIFSILPNASGQTPFTGRGSEQLAAGFVVYGPQTSLILTSGDGVDMFTLDREHRIYRLIRKRVQIPPECAEYAINASNHRHWEPPVRAFIDAMRRRRRRPVRQELQHALDRVAGRRSLSHPDPRRRLPLPVGCAPEITPKVACGYCTKPIRWHSSSNRPAAAPRPGASGFSISRPTDDPSAGPADHGLDQRSAAHRPIASAQ